MHDCWWWEVVYVRALHQALSANKLLNINTNVTVYCETYKGITHIA